MFDRIEQAPNLTTGLINSLVAQIESGQLVPGQRLPTEQAIVAATGVSRTVVREALASLRARGLITTRQGLGAFVCVGTPHLRPWSQCRPGRRDDLNRWWDSIDARIDTSLRREVTETSLHQSPGSWASR